MVPNHSYLLMQNIIGGKERGFKDGNFEDSLFDSPPGVCFRGENSEIIFIADTGNHAIRTVSHTYLYR